MSQPKSSQDLLLDEASDLYDAAQKLVEGLERLPLSGATSETRAAVETYLEQTRTHVQRLDEVFHLLGEMPRNRPNLQMADIVRSGITRDDNRRPHRGDAGQGHDAEALAIIQRAVRYAIGAYGSLIASATTVGAEEVAAILRQTLSEQKNTDETLRTAVDLHGDISAGDGPMVQELLRDANVPATE